MEHHLQVLRWYAPSRTRETPPERFRGAGGRVPRRDGWDHRSHLHCLLQILVNRVLLAAVKQSNRPSSLRQMSMQDHLEEGRGQVGWIRAPAGTSAAECPSKLQLHVQSPGQMAVALSGVAASKDVISLGCAHPQDGWSKGKRVADEGECCEDVVLVARESDLDHCGVKGGAEKDLSILP